MKGRPSARLLFVGAVAAVLVLTPVVALLTGGGKHPVSARVGPPSVDVSSADVQRGHLANPNDRPLPKARPTVVEPEAGVPGVVASGSGDGVPLEGPVTGAQTGGNSRAAIEAENQQYRIFLKQQKSFERLVKQAPGRYAISYGTGRLVWPLPSQYRTISSPFCERRAWEACHPGIDIPAPIGTQILAADAGTVIIAGPNGGYGNYTCVQHTKALSTCYAHQSRLLVRPGDDVRRGQVIGLVGCTGLCFGAHLHFETRNNGQVFDPMTFF